MAQTAFSNSAFESQMMDSLLNPNLSIQNVINGQTPRRFSQVGTARNIRITNGTYSTTVTVRDFNIDNFRREADAIHRYSVNIRNIQTQNPSLLESEKLHGAINQVIENHMQLMNEGNARVQEIIDNIALLRDTDSDMYPEEGARKLIKYRQALAELNDLEAVLKRASDSINPMSSFVSKFYNEKGIGEYLAFSTKPHAQIPSTQRLLKNMNLSNKALARKLRFAAKSALR